MRQGLNKGHFTFVLHGHLPYVLQHGTWPHGTDWLYESAAETYLPLLDVFCRLWEKEVPVKVVMGITPVLAEQLSHDSFKENFVDYLNLKIKAARENAKEFKECGLTEMANLADMWFDFYGGLLKKYISQWGRDIIWGFRTLQEEGELEIITSAATHGYLPLLKKDESVEAQVKMGIEIYEKHFGKEPKGIWLPECGYRPSYNWKPPVGHEEAYPRKGIEEVLNENGVQYFFVDTHLIRGGKAIGTYMDRFEALKLLWKQFEKEYTPEKKDRSPYYPYYVVSPGKDQGAIAFGRDPVTALQVWSGEHGYPGDFRYLEFHKKHFPGGHRYWKVTGTNKDLASKEIYEPEKARKAVKEHASHFISLIKEALREQPGGIMVAPYDAELFGHWWFEGPLWIEEVLEGLAQEEEVTATTCSEYLEEHPPREIVSLPEGSWGEGGFHYIWLNEWTQWVWEKIYQAEDLLFPLLEETRDIDLPQPVQEAITQMARELLLLQSSDWPFLITTWSARDYAEGRVAVHYQAFMDLWKGVKGALEDKSLPEECSQLLKRLQERDSLFPELDPWCWKEGACK